MRHHRPQSPILSFEKHPALCWHRAPCSEEGVLMQVACLCLFVCLPDCWSAHQRNHRGEKTRRDETERVGEGKKNKQNKVFCLDLLSAFMWHDSRPGYTAGFSFEEVLSWTGQASWECPCNYWERLSCSLPSEGTDT